MNTIGPVNNNTSFGMAWTKASSELFENIVDATVDEVASRAPKTGVAEFVSRRVDSHKLRQVKKAGKMVRAQNMASNAIEQDFGLRMLRNGSIVCDVFDIRTGEGLKTLKVNSNPKKSVMSNFQAALKRTQKYLDKEFAKIKAEDKLAAKTAKHTVDEAKLQAKLVQSHKARIALSSAAGESARRDINRLK